MDMHPLKAHRLSKKPPQSQEALAQALGVSRLTVLRWERGIRKIDDRLVSSVAKVTGIPAKKLRPDLVQRLKQLVGGDQ